MIERLLDVRMEIEKAIPENDMSQRYLQVGGHNLSFTSSGVRLVASILVCLLDKDFKSILIDEPELGISPEVQGVLADFLFDIEVRKKYFPHIEKLVFATHSTVFLDRSRISNNFIVEKSGDNIDVRQVRTQQEFNKIHFFLLGNRFETLYLPSVIFIVEGKCDDLFIRRVLELEFPNVIFSVIRAGDDGRIKQMVHIASSFFSDLQKSPYRDRIFTILDSVHQKGVGLRFDKARNSRRECHCLGQEWHRVLLPGEGHFRNIRRR